METATWTFITPECPLPEEGEFVLVTVEGSVAIARFMGEDTWEGAEGLVTAWRRPSTVTPHAW